MSLASDELQVLYEFHSKSFDGNSFLTLPPVKFIVEGVPMKIEARHEPVPNQNSVWAHPHMK